MKKFTIKKLILLSTLLILLPILAIGCGKKEDQKSERNPDYQYYTAKETKKFIEDDNNDKILLDIQIEKDYTKHHIKGAVPTFAYPVESDSDKAKLDKMLPVLESSDSEIIIVCPGGKGGATKSIDYLKKKGIDSDRLFILENGQSGWPYDSLLEKN